MKSMGRRKLNCSMCGKEFSTHSSNRTACYGCRPKCEEIHYFYAVKAREAKEAKDQKRAEEAAAEAGN